MYTGWTEEVYVYRMDRRYAAHVQYGEHYQLLKSYICSEYIHDVCMIIGVLCVCTDWTFSFDTFLGISVLIYIYLYVYIYMYIYSKYICISSRLFIRYAPRH